MITNGHAPSPSDFDLFGDGDMAAQGQQAMWIIDNVVGVEALEAVDNINWGVAPVPVEKAGDAAWVSSWTDAFGVFSESDNPEAAMKFITFLATDGSRLRTETGGFPLDLSVAEELDWAGDSVGRQEMVEVALRKVWRLGTLLIPCGICGIPLSKRVARPKKLLMKRPCLCRKISINPGKLMKV